MQEHDELVREFQDFAKTAGTAQLVMEHICQRLHEKMTRYNWVGFYLVDPADSGVLLVGPFAGSFTPNARIPISTGLCGAAASSGRSVVVQDVSKDSRYLAGSALVKSEIVVPILVKNKLEAELDIESYFEGTFTKPEQDFVEACARVAGEYLGKHQAPRLPTERDERNCKTPSAFPAQSETDHPVARLDHPPDLKCPD